MVLGRLAGRKALEYEFNGSALRAENGLAGPIEWM
jgi:hypothetical protein